MRSTRKQALSSSTKTSPPTTHTSCPVRSLPRAPCHVRSPVLFLRQLNALRKMPKRFHRWYGDQMTLKSELDTAARFVVQTHDVNIYNRTVRSRLEFEEVRASPEPVCLVHFKGPESKQAMHESLMLMEAR